MMITNTHLSKLVRHVKCGTTSTSPIHAICCYFGKYPSLSSSLTYCIRCISSKASDDQQSFMVSYLINNCGLSPKSALSSSKYLSFKTPDKPDSVIAFFKSHGFSMNQITKMIHTRSVILRSIPEKTFLPKIQFLYSKGFSSLDIVKVLSTCPDILHSNLENQLIPTFPVLQNLLQSDDKVRRAIKQLPQLMLSFSLGYVIPNIKLLKEIGSPQSSLVWLLINHPMALMTSSDRFAEIVEEVKGVGINPSLRSFVVAIKAIRGMSKSTWAKKFDIYKTWGWSHEEILAAFGKYPWVVMFSEKKIMGMMDYYINRMGWDSSFIAKHPILIALSLEKRVIPRCSVIQILLSKGLIRLTDLTAPLRVSEELFVRKFVIPYKEQVPHLLKSYNEKLNVAKCENIKKQL